AMLGDNYRDLWTRPVRLPVLHLSTFAGGVKALRVSGGKQTRSLRLSTSDSVEYTFRPIYKEGVNLPDDFKGSLVYSIFRDAGSASHPGANAASVPMVDLSGALHPGQTLVVMGDDPNLGEFRKEFAGLAGSIESYPTIPPTGAAHFANAVEILDAEELLDTLNKDPGVRVDARTLLRTRMVDMVLGDNDRHADQWRWAQLTPGGVFQPIARDRDKVFLDYEGMLLGLARVAAPALVKFEARYPNPSALFENATNFDRRLLGSLDRSVWDSTARSLQREITDAVIDQTIAAMPKEYAAGSTDLIPILRTRRDSLHSVAMRYYTQLFKVADVHGTDAGEVATVNRNANGTVRVQLQSGDGSPFFDRTFDPADTREIRVYLHGGDDRATISGAVNTTIPVRIIGGNGTNTFTDESVVGGRRGTTKLYDEGTVTDVVYRPDSVLEEHSYVDALNAYYNRRPWVHAFGTLVPPDKDYGAKIKPVFGLKTGHGLGLVPKIGIARYAYGFRKYPYANMVQADAAFSTGTRGWKFNLIADKRFASSDFHLPMTAQMSQLEVIQFRGFGNDVPEDDDPFFDVKQKMWTFKPGLGFSFAPGSDITLGPVVRYTNTDSTGFLALTRPYGFAKFGQAGAELALHYESRILPDSTKPRFIVDLAGAGYPATWDVESAYESLEGTAIGYVTIPFLTKPVIAVRGGGKKLFGDFPYFDAAFLGGGSSYRTEHRQRFAGDAAVFGSAELRVPLFSFPFITPTKVGALGFADAGRVYVDGDSPGGWHSAIGGGFWVAAVEDATNVNVLLTNNSNRKIIVSLGFAY
ncbi:MAG TPA: hypothetical protein VF042_08160, partial [Gemmatimonadaceae bacterium]